MGLIEDFVTSNGNDRVESIRLYMIENEIIDEFDTITNDTIKLFNFSVKYGIFDIVKFLYEKKNVEYDYDILLDYGSIIKSATPGPTDTVAMTGSSNTSVNVQIWDKFSKNRNYCINYLVNMKKYSKSRRCHKKFYYRFNQKYISLLS